MDKRALLFLGSCLLGQENAWAAKSVDQNVVVVKQGENLLDVAKRCGSTTDDLIKSNGLLKPYKIYIGQPLIYNKPEPVAPKPVAPKPAAPKKQAEQQPKVTPAMTAAPKSQPTRDYYSEESAVLNKLDTREPSTSLNQSTTSTKDLKRTGKHFSWPVEGKVLSNFGKKETGRKNDGINIEVKFQSPVKAAEDGVVVYAGNEIRGFGNVILIKHGDSWSSVYAHNDILLVKKGEHVKRGQEIAKSGNTGHVDTPQLHFELRHKAQPMDPVKYLR